MPVYIEIFNELEAYTKQHLMYLSNQDTGLSFILSDYSTPHLETPSIDKTHVSNLTSEGRFYKVELKPTLSSLGGELLSYLTNYPIPAGGDLIIAPRGSESDVVLFNGDTFKMKKLGGGWINFFENTNTGKVDALISYDSTRNWTEINHGVNYVTKDHNGNCIPMYRHIILAHELAHAATVHSVSKTNPFTAEREELFESIAMQFENNYREELGLPLRDTHDVVEEETPGFCP